MKKTIFFLLTVLFLPAYSSGSTLAVPEVRLINNEIFVDAALMLDDKETGDLRNGIEKEFTFHIDLFRVWKIWPNEFVLGKKIVNTLKCDPVKKEYVATSAAGSALTEKRFNEFEPMLKWALNITHLKLTNTKELERDNYFVRVTAESRLRRLPPVIGYLFFFVPEKEFRIFRDSQPFLMENIK